MAEINNSVVSIRFSGPGLEPKVIGELLGFIESQSVKSRIMRLKSGRVVWTIRIENEEPIENKIETLLAQFTNDIKRWKIVTEKNVIDIFCGLFLDGWNKGFDLTPKIMEKLSSRNLKIGFDIYAPVDTWYQSTE